MKIAVTYEDGQVFQHFGRTQEFKVYDVEDGKVVSSRVIGNEGLSHGALGEILMREKVDVFICGGIGGGARQMITSRGIELLPGVSGDADAVVSDYLAGKLDYDPDASCHAHGEHHNCSHSCH
jgi:predicted Fe-Mo cluster-binding NifX family protein